MLRAGAFPSREVNEQARTLLPQVAAIHDTEYCYLGDGQACLRRAKTPVEARGGGHCYGHSIDDLLLQRFGERSAAYHARGTSEWNITK